MPTSKRKCPTQKSSRTSAADSTSSGKDLRPYWNAACKAISSQLWLPTATDSHGSALSSSNGLSSVTVDRSWFSARLLTPAQPTNFYKTCSQCLTSLLPKCADSVNTVTKSRRLYPTAEQKTLFRRWLGTARFVYNQTLAYPKTLRAKSVRALLTWAHSKFKKRLKGVAEQSCTIIIEVSEAYTPACIGEQCCQISSI